MLKISVAAHAAGPTENLPRIAYSVPDEKSVNLRKGEPNFSPFPQSSEQLTGDPGAVNEEQPAGRHPLVGPERDEAEEEAGAEADERAAQQEISRVLRGHRHPPGPEIRNPVVEDKYRILEKALEDSFSVVSKSIFERKILNTLVLTLQDVL